MFERVRRDLQRYFSFESDTGDATLLEKLKIVARNHALKGVLVYRFGSWIERTVPKGPARLPLKIAYRTLDELVTAAWGMHIHATANIEGGLYISHPFGILIGSIKMGEDCNVGQGVTIGLRPGEEGHLPTIGNRVFIGSGSVVFGGITVADGAAIGPLTVVGRNLPPRCLAIGNPMQIVNRDYANDALIYGTRAVKQT